MGTFLIAFRDTLSTAMGMCDRLGAFITIYSLSGFNKPQEAGSQWYLEIIADTHILRFSSNCQSS